MEATFPIFGAQIKARNLRFFIRLLCGCNKPPTMKLVPAFLIGAVAVATARPGHLGGGGFGGGHSGFSGGFGGGHGGGGGGYTGEQAHITVGQGGFVQDTPEVAAHKSAHLAAVAATHARDAHVNAQDAASGGGGGYGGHGHHH